MALPWTTAEEIEERREAIARRNAVADAAIREHGPAAVMRAAQEALAAAAQPAIAAEIRRGLIGVVREAAERPWDDIVLQALHVASGAAAIGVGSPCEDDTIDIADLWAAIVEADGVDINRECGDR